MSPAEIAELIKTLKESGVKHFKHGDLELSFESKTHPQAGEVMSLRPLKASSLKTPPAEPDEQPPHIIQEMKSLLKLSDEDLLERIFPLPQQDVEA